MTGPGWLAGSFAAVMLVIAGCCAARLVIWRVRGKAIELEADALHVLMGVAMAGMLEPRLSPAPAVVWRAVFAAAAAWFTWQAVSTRSRRRSRSWRCAHPGPHAVESAAMIYMLLPLHPPGHGPVMAMPGMAGAAATANPALALVLALFMAGDIFWTSDQLATLSRAGAGTARSAGAGAARGEVASTAALAPRFAACYKIAMGVAMGYMLITMV